MQNVFLIPGEYIPHLGYRAPLLKDFIFSPPKTLPRRSLGRAKLFRQLPHVLEVQRGRFPPSGKRHFPGDLWGHVGVAVSAAIHACIYAYIGFRQRRRDGHGERVDTRTLNCRTRI